MDTMVNKLGIGYNMIHDLIVLYERFGDGEFTMKDVLDSPTKFYNKRELMSKLYKLNLIDKRSYEKDKRVKYYRLNITYSEYQVLKEYFSLLNVYKEVKVKLDKIDNRLPEKIKRNILKLKLLT